LTQLSSIEVAATKKVVINQALVLKFINQDRKTTIWLSTEKLFAKRSYDGVYIRDIANGSWVPSPLARNPTWVG
ncbi:hypothetical protein QN360_14120, partial [Glaciimonas sp. CA11.2]|uniref:hypothetical protein n=1 Tax=Glaciimonas sp. CA11.2 TaxID=3048601 RepID=UPI002B22415E